MMNVSQLNQQVCVIEIILERFLKPSFVQQMCLELNLNPKSVLDLCGHVDFLVYTECF